MLERFFLVLTIILIKTVNGPSGPFSDVLAGGRGGAHNYPYANCYRIFWPFSDAAILFWLEGVALTTVAMLGILGNAVRSENKSILATFFSIIFV